MATPVTGGRRRRVVRSLRWWIDERLLEAALDERGGNPDAPNTVTDPMFEVLREDGPYYTWGNLDDYTTPCGRPAGLRGPTRSSRNPGDRGGG